MTYLLSAETSLRAWLWRLTQREDGQDMIEYSLLTGLISIVAIAGIVLVGPYLKDTFQIVVNALAGL